MRHEWAGTARDPDVDRTPSSTMSVTKEPRGGVRKPMVAVSTPSRTGPSPTIGARSVPVAVRMVMVDGAQEGIVTTVPPLPCDACRPIVSPHASRSSCESSPPRVIIAMVSLALPDIAMK